MNKLIPRNKVLFQTKACVWNNLKILKLRKKKWFFFINFFKNQLSKNNKILNQNPESLKKLYKRKLLAKQKFKSFYGNLSERQIKNIFQKFKNKSNKIELYYSFFEKRLDIILLRLNIVSTIFEIKQLINHKKILINNKIINFSNYNLKIGDFIYIKKKNCKFNLNKNYEILKIPKYLEYNKKLNIVTLINNPKKEDIYYYFNNELNLIFESISK